MANEFVWMEKDGERIEVHPLMVAEHERLKWRKVGGQARSAESLAAKEEAEEKASSLKKRRNG